MTGPSLVSVSFPLSHHVNVEGFLRNLTVAKPGLITRLYSKLEMILIDKKGLALLASAQAYLDPQFIADGEAYFDLVAPCLCVALRVPVGGSF